MAIEVTQVSMPAVVRLTVKPSKYKFEELVVGSDVAVVESEVGDSNEDVTRATNKLTSALVAYRKRTGDKRKFTTRPFKTPEGKNAVGVWCLAAAPAPKVAPEVAATASVGEAEAA